MLLLCYCVTLIPGSLGEPLKNREYPKQQRAPVHFPRVPCRKTLPHGVRCWVVCYGGGIHGADSNATASWLPDAVPRTLPPNCCWGILAHCCCCWWNKPPHCHRNQCSTVMATHPHRPSRPALGRRLWQSCKGKSLMKLSKMDGDWWVLGWRSTLSSI